jgi:hypothetical protein
MDTAAAKQDTIRFLRWLMAGAPAGGALEIRVIPSRGAPLTGFFPDAVTAAGAVAPWSDGQGQVYVGLNPRRVPVGAPVGRLQAGAPGGKATDVLATCHVLIDVDPVRPKGTASTQEELEAARVRARGI